MKEINHTYSLKPDWQFAIAAQIGAPLIDNKWIVQPENLGAGGSYFLEVAPGLSVVVLDLVFNQPVRIRRDRSEEDFYIIHYDFSDEMNVMKINDEKHKIGYRSILGLGVIDNRISNVFEPVVGERVFAIRLLVAKKILDFPMKSGTGKGKKNPEKTLYFYDHVDSKSKVIMHRIKNKSFSDPAYDLYLRGVAFKLLAKFMDRYANLKTINRITESDIKALSVTKEYLMNNVLEPFPGLDFLSDMAGMSVSKYKALFKEVYLDAPNKFYIREKMLLAQELLKSGAHTTLSAVMLTLGYNRLNYFAAQYHRYTGNHPSDDLKKE